MSWSNIFQAQFKTKQKNPTTPTPPNKNKKEKKITNPSICNRRLHISLHSYLHENVFSLIMTTLYVPFHPLGHVSLQDLFSNSLFGFTCPAKSCKLFLGISTAFTNNRLRFSGSPPSSSQCTRTSALSARPAQDLISLDELISKQAPAKAE